jgi:hypothetical protein
MIIISLPAYFTGIHQATACEQHMAILILCMLHNCRTVEAVSVATDFCMAIYATESICSVFLRLGTVLDYRSDRYNHSYCLNSVLVPHVSNLLVWWKMKTNSLHV